MLFFGPAGIPAAGSNEEGIELVARLGLNALEVEFVRGVRMRPEEARRLGKLAAERGLRLSAHAPYYVNLNSKNQKTIENSKVHILATMLAARELGAKVIVVHAGFYSGMGSEDATEVIAQGIIECRERADREGCGDVLLGLETMGRRATWGTPAEIAAVAGRVKGVVPVIDFAHMHARCQGCLRDRKDFEGVLRDFEALGAPFLHSHFTGIEFGQAGERRHLDVSSRSPDFELLAPLLVGRKYDITVICESPLPEQDALLLKKLAFSAGN